MTTPPTDRAGPTTLVGREAELVEGDRFLTDDEGAEGFSSFEAERRGASEVVGHFANERGRVPVTGSTKK